MLSREQLSTATAWGLDTAVSLKLTIPSRHFGPPMRPQLTTPCLRWQNAANVAYG